MYAIPRNQRLVIIDDAVARLIGSKLDHGDSIGVTFAAEFGVASPNERWWLFSLYTGTSIQQTLEVRPDTYAAEQQWAASYASSEVKMPRPTQPYGIVPGQAYITRRRKAGFVLASQIAPPLLSEDVTIYVDHWFAIGDPARDELDVARDAWFGQDFVRAKEIVEKVIPHSYQLFLAAIKLEFDMLQRETNPEVSARLGSAVR